MKPVFNKIFLLCAVSGIIGLVSARLTTRHDLFVYLYVITNIIFILGFVSIAKKTKNRLLFGSSWALIFLFVLYLVMYLNPDKFLNLKADIFTLYLNVFGLVGVLYGVSLFNLKKILSLLAPLAGTISILGSAFFVVFKFLDKYELGFKPLEAGYFLATLACALEILILVRASQTEKLKKGG